MSASGDAAVYLVADRDRAVLIDAGTGAGHDRVVENISACLPEAASIENLFLTHCHYDHTGGAEKLRESYHLKVIAHEQDAVFLEKGDNTVTAASWYGASLIPFTVDHKINRDTETFRIGETELQTIHWPGHSPGSIILMLERAGKKIVFGQDVHGPLHPSLLSNREDYLFSLNRLKTLEADILCEGHYGIIKGKEEVKRFISQFIN